VEGIDVLQRDKVRIPVQHFDGVTIPYKSASLDVVMFIDVLHHTGDPVSLLREAARVARKSIVIKDHLFDGLLAESTLRFMDRIGNVRYGVALPGNFWRLSQWQKAFRALALTPVEWRKELGLYPKILDLWFGRPLHFPAKLEAAYSRFETSGQEIRKFIRRLRSMGAMSWDRNPAVVELFCGRGNGLVALSRLGFSQIEGVDLSPSHRFSSGDGIMGIPTMEETDRPDRFVRARHACHAVPCAPVFDCGRTLGPDRYVGIYTGDAGATIPFTC